MALSVACMTANGVVRLRRLAARAGQARPLTFSKSVTERESPEATSNAPELPIRVAAIP